MANILIIDDDPAIVKVMTVAMVQMGHRTRHALTLKTGVDAIHAGSFDVVFLDVNLPDGNGLEILPRIRESRSAPEVIIVTGEGDPDGAELAIKSGAWDYLQKPPSLQAITLPLNRVLQYREEKRAGRKHEVLNREGIIGHSPAVRQCLQGIAGAAKTEANVLITGETGTGKELFAHAIHKNSSRCRNSFVVVDCSALPETLVESTLFGHAKGAFTGADAAREGLIRQADGGTLFLDEVGELSPAAQKAFLRVLQERRFRPVGARKELRSRFRLIVATHRDLDCMVEEGRFRQDLLYRIRSVAIELPPLRKRRGDILEIALYHMTRFSRRYGTGTKGFSPEFIDALSVYRWPGNVRELVNCVESALSEAETDPILLPIHLPTRIRVQLARASIAPAKATAPLAETADIDGSVGRFRDFRDAALSRAEKAYLVRLLKQVRGDLKQACTTADLSRARLYALLKKHGLSGRGKPRDS